jgi:hypothetical protein
MATGIAASLMLKYEMVRALEHVERQGFGDERIS